MKIKVKIIEGIGGGSDQGGGPFRGGGGPIRGWVGEVGVARFGVGG